MTVRKPKAQPGPSITICVTGEALARSEALKDAVLRLLEELGKGWHTPKKEDSSL